MGPVNPIRAIGRPAAFLALLLAPAALRAQRPAPADTMLGAWELRETAADNPDLGADTLVVTLELRADGRWTRRTRLAKLLPGKKNGRALFIDRGRWRFLMRPDSAGVERQMICLFPSDNLPDPEQDGAPDSTEEYRCGTLRRTDGGLALDYAEGSFMRAARPRR